MTRKILDQAKTVKEAVSLVQEYIPFDLDENSFHGHFQLVDASGMSAILEYDQGQWRTMFGDKSWQALTTKPAYSVSDASLRDQCWRYRSMAETLEKTDGHVGWRAGMGILKDVAQEGTTWSVIYSPTTREVYFSVYQEWDKIYHLRRAFESESIERSPDG